MPPTAIADREPHQHPLHAWCRDGAPLGGFVRRSLAKTGSSQCSKVRKPSRTRSTAWARRSSRRARCPAASTISGTVIDCGRFVDVRGDFGRPRATCRRTSCTSAATCRRRSWRPWSRPTDAERPSSRRGELKACQRISSFEKKPARPGMPAIASEPMNIVQNVIGILSLQARPCGACPARRPWRGSPSRSRGRAGP